MRHFLVTLTTLTLLISSGAAQPLDLDIYADNEQPKDARLGPLKDLNGYFPLSPVPASKAAWLRRANQVRQRILVSCGLLPMPPRPKVDATIHGRVERDKYTVEKVYFESYPGLYVTGSLYRPRGKSGRRPVVLSPHGHWNQGRFYECPENQIAEQLSTGAEIYEVAARYPLQARCVQLARMGCIVFHYDMLGYADSKPITYERAHRHAEARPELEDPHAWGLYTAQAEMRMQSVFGMQTFNSLRALDFVSELPDVDPHRIGVTGASGGGTQTMILAAIEPRVSVSFPAVMVSTAMQGGCTCENACCLRVGTGNVEFAALFCPKPQGINAANDWTVELATKGLPELKQLYKLFGAESNVEGYPLVQFPHNYNAVSRGKMYAWMNRHFNLGYAPKEIQELEFEPLTVREMSVWNDRHPTPPADLAAEQKLLQEIAKISDQQSATQAPAKRRDLVRLALETLTATSWNDIGPVQRENLAKIDMESFWLFKDILRYGSQEIPTVFLHPKDWNNKVVVWTAEAGKRSLLNSEDKVRNEAQQLLDKGFAIAAPDLFRQGEFETEQLTQTRKVANDRDFAGFTFGYNRTLLAHRVQDLLTIIKFITEDDHAAQATYLLGVEGGTAVASVASALAGELLDRLVIDDASFRFSAIKSWRDPNFLPGAVKYGDLPEFLKLAKDASAAESLDQALRQIE